MIGLDCSYLKVKNAVVFFIKKRDGVTALEFAFLIAGVSVTVFFIFNRNGSFGVMQSSMWTAMQEALNRMLT